MYNPWWVDVIVYAVVGSWWAYLFTTNQRRDTLSEDRSHREGQVDRWT